MVNRPIRRLSFLLLLGMGILVVGATWHQAVAADRYRSHPDNRRIALLQAGKQRGVISTASGTVLAFSEPDPDLNRSFLRKHPGGEAFASLLGSEEAAVGLESVYAQDLRSRQDLSVSDLMAAFFGEDLRPRGLQITIDAGLQQRAYDILTGRRGAVAAVDPTDGKVLALASSPGPAARERAAAYLYPLGSAFQIVTVAAALGTGTASADRLFEDRITWQTPGDLTIVNPESVPCGDAPQISLLDAFVTSCHLPFAEVALEMGAGVMQDYASGFRFGVETDFPLFTPTPLWGADESSEDALAAYAGTGGLAFSSPLHMATVAAAIANGGAMVMPSLTAAWTDADGEVTEIPTAAPPARIVSVETASELAEMMERVVTEGDGQEATVAGHRVAGKTGTGQDAQGRHHTWFVGFAPVESPTIALAVMIEPGGEFGESVTGRTAAAPVASELLSYWLLRSLSAG